MAKKTKRRTYLVDRAVQFRYMALVVIPLVMLLGGLYYLIYYSVSREMLIREAIATILLPAMKRVNVTVGVTLPVALLLILRVALIYSNRIIGPLSRLEKELDKIIKGDPSVRLKVRDKDVLKNFVNKVNRALDNFDKNDRF